MIVLCALVDAAVVDLSKIKRINPEIRFCYMFMTACFKNDMCFGCVFFRPETTVMVDWA